MGSFYGPAAAPHVKLQSFCVWLFLNETPKKLTGLFRIPIEGKGHSVDVFNCEIVVQL